MSLPFDNVGTALRDPDHRLVVTAAASQGPGRQTTSARRAREPTRRWHICGTKTATTPI